MHHFFTTESTAPPVIPLLWYEMCIRDRSDTADHAANISFDEFIVEAGERSAQTLMTFLKRLV